MARPNRKEDPATSLALETLDANDPRFWVTLDNKGVQAWKKKPITVPVVVMGEIPEIAADGTALTTSGSIAIINEPGGYAIQATTSGGEVFT